jgi:hypothetical protein
MGSGRGRVFFETHWMGAAERVDRKCQVVGPLVAIDPCALDPSCGGRSNGPV